MSAHLRAMGDPRWTIELLWAAKYAAAQGAKARALGHLQASAARNCLLDVEHIVAVLGALGEVQSVLLLLSHLEGGYSYLASAAAALRSAHDANDEATASAVARAIDAAHQSGPIAEPGHELGCFALIVEHAAWVADANTICVVADRTTQVAAPYSFPATVHLELIRAHAARTQSATDRELSALRAAYDACGDQPTAAWTRVLTATTLARLVELEGELGDPLLGELITRRLALSQFRRWVPDHMPAEQARWLQLIESGTRSVVKDQVQLDPSDPLVGQHLFPTAYSQRLSELITQVSLGLLTAHGESRVQAATSVYDAVREQVMGSNAQLPLALVTTRCCDARP